jgi:hypothetical protein
LPFTPNDENKNGAYADNEARMNEELSIKQQIRHSHIHKQYTAYDYDGQLSFIHSHFATITFQPFTLPDSHGLAMKFLEYPQISVSGGMYGF